MIAVVSERAAGHREFRLIDGVGKPLLLLRPARGEYESFPAYLTRLCSINRLRGVGALAKLLRLTYGQLILLGPQKFGDILHGKTCIALDPAATDKRLPVGRVSNMNGVCTGTRLCSLCLKGGNLCLAEWDWPLSLICKHHHILLIDTCPRCGARVSHLRSVREACGCGFDYRRCVVAPAPAWVERFHAIFAPWRNDEATDSLELTVKESKSLLILRGLMSPADKLDCRGRLNSGPNHALLRSSQVDAVGLVMARWPDGILDHIARLHRRAASPAMNLIEKALRLDLPDLTRVVQSALDVIQAQEKTSRGKRNALDKRIRSVSGIGRITGLNHRTVEGLVMNGTIKATIARRTANRRIEMSIAEADHLRTLYGSTISLNQAAEHLGCDNLFVNLLAKAGVLLPVKVTTNSKTWRFTLADLDRCLSEIALLANHEHSPFEEVVPLISLAVKNHAGTPEVNWIRFAKRIAAGEIPVFKIDTSAVKLASFAIKASDIPKRKGVRPATSSGTHKN